MVKTVSFDEKDAQVILNLLEIACGSPNQKPGGLQVALQAANISSKILTTFNSEVGKDVENKDGDRAD